MEKYWEILDTLKRRIRDSKLKAVLHANAEMLALYHEIGRTIADLEKNHGWGAKVIEKLSADLRAEFEGSKGFSPRNLRYMRNFAIAYPYFPFLQVQLAKIDTETSDFSSEVILQGALAKLPWYHHITLLDKVKDQEIRKFYLEQAIENGWSRDILVNQIEGQLHNRQGRLISNFSKTIPSSQSELVQQLFKDPYKFDFVSLGPEAKKRDLEDALTNQLSKLLVELGRGFAFMGRQYRIMVGEKEYFFDLLFYHTRLKRFIVIELKIGEFKPEDAGKMQFYLTVADRELKSGSDEDSIGLILCKTKDGLVAEYALLDSSRPVGIAEYKFNELLPEDIKGELPEIEEIEQRMSKELNDLRTPAEKRIDQLKKTLASINRQEITTTATQELLNAIFDRSMKPLYTALFARLDQFKNEFIDISFSWHGYSSSVSTLDLLGFSWKAGSIFLNNTTQIDLVYRLSGLKKAGIEARDLVITLGFKMDAYWYGLILVNYNNQQPFIRKPYTDQFSEKEIQQICDTVMEQVIIELELQLGL